MKNSNNNNKDNNIPQSFNRYLWKGQLQHFNWFYYGEASRRYMDTIYAEMNGAKILQFINISHKFITNKLNRELAVVCYHHKEP